MYNIMIVEDNKNQCNQIINYISLHTNDFKKYNICNSGLEAIKLLRQKDMDIIILDLGLPDLSGIDILKFLKNNLKKRYERCVIIISGNTNLISELTDFDCVYKIMLKPIILEELFKNINLFLIEKRKEKYDKILYKKICSEIEKLNYNFSHNGTRYLIEVILELYKVKDDFNSNKEDNFKKYVYPIIAKKHSKNVDTIYGNIKQATKQMFNRCEKDFIYTYFNYRRTL